MNLQTFIAQFITVVNNIFIPFMLGIAFLIFVINVFRFFIVGGSNQEAQAKAKSLAVYGIGAFVFIIIFWGIINILTSSLGLTRVGDTTARCFDYECPNGSTPNVAVAPPPTPTPPPPSTPPAPRPSAPPTGPGAPPSAPNAPAPLAPPAAPTPPTLDTPPTNQGPGPGGDYSQVAREQEENIFNVFGEVDDTFLMSQFLTISAAGMNDGVRLSRARSFADAGFISETDFQSIVNNINTARSEGFLPPIQPTTITANRNYTLSLQTYTANVQTAERIITNWYGDGSFTAVAELDKLFNTAEYTLPERRAASGEVINQMTSLDPALSSQLRNAISGAHTVETQYRN